MQAGAIKPDTACHQAPETGAAQNITLSRDSVRRILLSLISVEQSALIKRGAISKESALALLTTGRSTAEIDALAIDETALGFDSLSRLDLVFRINQFFNLHRSGVEDYLLLKLQIGDWVDLVMHHLTVTGDQAAFSFQSAGSTGAPKMATHRLTALRAEVIGLIDHVLPFGGDQHRILAMVPPHHIYGFVFCCLLPSVADFDTVDLHQKPPGSVFSRAHRGDLIVATPFLWEQMIRAGLQLPQQVFGITSAGPSTALTWSATVQMGLKGLTEIYGATQTGGIGFRHCATADFKLLPHLLRDQDDIRARSGARDTLDLQDRLQWTDTQHFQIDGRLDAVVQVAGVNVSPQHVEDVIGAVAGVAASHVRLQGDRLKAYIVPGKGETPARVEATLHRHLIENLPPPARPATITFGTELPRNAFGKLTDWA